MFLRWAGLAGLSIAVTVASAQPQPYAQRGIQIRAGIVVIDSSQTAGVPANPTPHIWYNLDSNSAVKPAGWNIYNPNAPTQASPDIVSRWTLISGVVGGNAPQAYDQITKRMAAYWEVQLSKVSQAQLAQYDVLFLNASGNVSLNPLERERLRQFVDRGGVLWIETAGINRPGFEDNATNNFPLPFRVVLGGGPNGELDQFHPVLSYPYAFNISNLNYLNGGGTASLTQAAVPGAASSFSSPVIFDWFRLKPVVRSGTNTTMMVGRIGDGFMVVTSRDAAGFLNQLQDDAGAIPPYLTNRRYYAVDPRGRMDQGSDIIGRLAINIISLGSGSEQVGAGSRKSGSTSVDIGAPLLKRFDTRIEALDPGQKKSLPVATYKNIIVVSSNDRIYVYDSSPKQDLDGDNNPDDGVQDYNLGNNVDLLWSSVQMNGPISAPTCVEVARPSGAAPVNGVADQILVTTADGEVVAFAAFPVNGAGQIIGNPLTPPLYTVGHPDSSPASSTFVNAPTYQEGLVYVATNHGSSNPSGSVWVLDPANGVGLTTGTNRWYVGGTGGPVISGEITASPTVGYIPIADNSGGLDRVAYVPAKASGQSAGIHSLWIGARGESPTSVATSGATLTVATRASQKGLFVVTGSNSYGIKLTVLKPNGDPLTIPEMNTLFDGSVNQGVAGVLDFGITGVWDPNYTVRIDYTIDWGREPRSSILRGNIFLPDDNLPPASNRRSIIGNIAMSPRGTIYVVHSTGDDTIPPVNGAPNRDQGGAFYAFREQGQGAFKCITRYDVYGPHTVNLNQVGPTQLPATVEDHDELTGMIPFLSGTTNRVTYVGGPVVRGDFVYVTASLRKLNPSFGFIAPFIPYTVVFAFNAEPEAPEISVGDLSEGFSLVQPDLVRSATKSTPTTLNVATQGIFQYVRSTGKIRFDNLMTPNRGQIQTAFSLSQPIILRSGGRPDQLIYPDAKPGSRWSPLAWYVVLHGVSRPTTPVVTGGTLFVGGSSALPHFIDSRSGTPTMPPPSTGVLFGFNADISERDPLTIVDSSRPWLRQVFNLKMNGLQVTPNANIRWPQTQGVTDFDSWAVRVLQASMPNTGRTISVSAGDGGLYATGGAETGAMGGDGYLFGFSRADFIVCDEGRLGRFDPSGNPIFSTDVSSSAGDTNTGTTSAIRAIQRPVRAYPVGVNDIVAVDPGTNRIVRLDGGGREIRSITGFQLDPLSNITLEANESLTLNNPRDVAVYSEFVVNPTGVSNPQSIEYWVHYVVADAGNRRIIDLIDRYAVGANRQIGNAIVANGERQLAVLRWHSPAEYSGKRFEYNAITRAADPVSGQYFYIAGIGNATPTRVDTGLTPPASGEARETSDGNGGIVIFSPGSPGNNQVINEVTIPNVGAGVYIDPQTLNYDPNPRATRQKKLINLSSVTARKVLGGPNGSLYAIMFTDSTGVYEIVNTGSGWFVRWMMPNEVYRFLRNNPPALAAPPGTPPTIFNSNALTLRATYARRLDSGEVLIVNGYVGKYRNSDPFRGEVVQVNGDITNSPLVKGFDWNKRNFGFYFGSISFELPPVVGTRGLNQPVFADRR